MGRHKQIDVMARDVVEQLRAGRKATFTTTDPVFRSEVLKRVNQLWEGDLSPWYGEENND